MVTVKDIRARFNLRGEVNIKQIGSKQLFIVDCPINGRLLISYYTVVGYFNDKWYLTKYKYSLTTSKQLNQFARTTNFQVEWVNEQITLKVH